MSDLPKEAGRFYHSDGRPCYTLVGKNGRERNTHVGDARQMELVPSVTTVIGILDKPGLNNWIQDKVILAAEASPKRDGESDRAYCSRIRERDTKAADRGTALHKDIELAIQGKPHGHVAHIDKIALELAKIGVSFYEGRAEHSFACTMGYGGKTDFHLPPWLLDFKSKDSIERGKKLVFDEHIMQLSSYAAGLEIEEPRCANVFVGVDDCEVVIHEWKKDEIERGYDMFLLLLAFWKIKNNFA